MIENIDERLKKLLRDFDDLLTESRLLQKSPHVKQTTQNDLVRFFGLTSNEAKEWLKSEPNFIPSDDSYHDNKSDKKLPEPLAGSAGGKIERKLKDLGLTIAKPSKSAIVKGREGPLEESAEGTFKQIGAELAKKL